MLVLHRYRNLWSAITMLGAWWAGTFTAAPAQSAPTEAQSGPPHARRMTAASSCRPAFARPFLPTASDTRATWSSRRTESSMSTPGPAAITATTRRMPAASWSRCRTPPGAGKANVNQRFGETVQSGGAGGTGIGLYKGGLFAEINDKIVRYSLPARLDRPAASCGADRVGIAAGRRSSHASFRDRLPTAPCTSTSPPRPMPARRKIARRNRRASTRARSSRRAAASGAMTRTRPTKPSHRPSASPPAYAMPRASRSMPPDTSSSRSTGATSCTRIGRISTNPRRKRRNRPRSCCC